MVSQLWIYAVTNHIELLNEIYNELVKHFKSNTQIDSNTINNIVNHAKTILASNH